MDFKFKKGDRVRVTKLEVNRYPFANKAMAAKCFNQIFTINDCIKAAGCAEDCNYEDIPIYKIKCDDNSVFYFREDWLENASKKYWTGKVVCTEFYDGNDFMINKFQVGKVYEVKNGTLRGDYNISGCPFVTHLTDVNDLNTRCENYDVKIKFIEFKGFNK